MSRSIYEHVKINPETSNKQPWKQKNLKQEKNHFPSENIYFEVFKLSFSVIIFSLFLVFLFFWEENNNDPSRTNVDLIHVKSSIVSYSLGEAAAPGFASDEDFSPDTKQLTVRPKALTSVWLKPARSKQTCQTQSACLTTSFSSRSPWTWPGTPLASQALSLPPGKASGPLLWQWVVVGVFLWSLKQHLSVGDNNDAVSDSITQIVNSIYNSRTRPVSNSGPIDCMWTSRLWTVSKCPLVPEGRKSCRTSSVTKEPFTLLHLC